MSSFSLAIFDYDGTLADSFPWFCSVLNQTARQFGFREVTQDEIDELRALGTREIVARLGVAKWKLPAIAMHMRKLSAESRDAVALFPGVGPMLASLAASNIRVAIVSSNTENTIRRTLGPAAVHVSHFQCGASLWGKGAMFKAVIKRLGADKRRTIAIGDEVRDIEAARGAGIASGAVTFGYNAGATLRAQGPDLVFDNYVDLVAKLTA
ncbi:phosphoglycolate phosphatase [Aminobacter aminovorans]|jgi:phosphoglycolate phosphatase|uniref:Phosphoglycolate phosphatase n=1 Tax=Aminobacter aminovorans TaxID=83263 RepID=A0A380WRJ9_AMIAI|nr:HAD-IA family hydrolase [Aminobacter aminovorans]TCS23564.1 phosphoglycolate phosphatase [Aminobacter aminovorans]SUU91530.1 Phosphoglycolate phosphatase [Aminobacter aminovorans]